MNFPQTILEQSGRVLQSPITALFLAVVLAGLSLSGKFTVTATYVLLFTGWLLALFGFRDLALPLMVGYGAITGGCLVLASYWFSPEPIPGYSGVLYPKVDTLLSANKRIIPRIFEFGDSGAKLAIAPDAPQDMPLFNFFDESNLTIESIDGKLKVSTTIIDVDGTLVAELFRNEWKVAPPPRIWDRNYTDDALEVRNSSGRIVLQIRVLPDRIQLQGEWWSKDGYGVRFCTKRDPQTGQMGGAMVKLARSINPDTPRVEPIFAYPSDRHFGELLRR